MTVSPQRRTLRSALVVGVSLTLLVTGCASSSDPGSDDPGAVPTATADQTVAEACEPVVEEISRYKVQSDEMLASGQTSTQDLATLMSEMSTNFDAIAPQIGNDEVRDVVLAWNSASAGFLGAINTALDNGLDLQNPDDVTVLRDLIPELDQINLDLEYAADGLDMTCEGLSY